MRQGIFQCLFRQNQFLVPFRKHFLSCQMNEFRGSQWHIIFLDAVVKFCKESNESYLAIHYALLYHASKNIPYDVILLSDINITRYGSK